MRVCHIVASLEARYGGPSKSVLEITRAQARAGNAVELLATDPAKPHSTREGTLAIDVFLRGSPAMVCPSAGLKKHLQTIQSDVIECHGLWLRTLGYAHATASRQGIPLVIAPRGMMADWAWNHHRFRKWLSGHLIHPGALEEARGWHATSTEEADDIRRRGFRRATCVAPNGVTPLSHSEITEGRAIWLKRLPETATRPVALFYSRFHSKKRVRELIRLWSERPDDGWLLLVVGIPEEFSVQTLEDDARAFGCSERVRICDGRGLPAPYAVASLFLLPSHNENFGMVVAEAMAAGVPVLVTDTTPWKSAQEQGAGWCVPWSSYPSALDSALTEPITALQSKGKQAKEWVLSAYSWAKSASILTDFYQSLRA